MNRGQRDHELAVLDLVPLGIFVLARDTRILFWNRCFEDWTGVQAKTAVGALLADIFPGMLEPGRRARLDQVFTGGAPAIFSSDLHQDMLPLQFKNGAARALHTTVSALTRSVDGSFDALVVVRDVTDLARQVQDLRESQIAAEAANVAKSEFLAAMSHEIRTPMNGVISMAELLLESDLSPEQYEKARTISESSKVLLELVNGILDLSKIEAGELSIELIDVDLRGVVEGVVELWGPRLVDKGLSFTVEFAEDVPVVLKTDPTRIRQILLNLISNAAKFTSTGSVILHVTHRPLRNDEHELRLAVTDTGIGIAPEAHSLMFAKFSQADGSITRRYGGTGLGLAICKALAEALGGEIGFDSTPDQGSTFWFTIRCALGDPAMDGDTLRAREVGRINVPDSGRPLRILVAEDNLVNQIVVRALLERTGHHIDMVSDGAAAVSAVQRKFYDLVLMDVQMPEMDGLTATRRIRELPGGVAQLPVIGVTAGAMKGDREECLEAGMTDYLSKPIDRDALFGAIARAVAGSDLDSRAVV